MEQSAARQGAAPGPECIGAGGEPGELKHLTYPEEKRGCAE